MKKLLRNVLAFVASFCFISNVSAITPDEKMLENLPDTITFDVKESEAFSASFYEELEVKKEELKKELESQGYDLTGYYLSIDFIGLGWEYYELASNIHYLSLAVYTEDGDVTIPTARIIKAVYANSDDFNETDAQYVKDKIAPIWFHRYDWVDVESEEEFTTAEEEFKRLINDESISIYTEESVCGGNLILNCNSVIYFFKNDVLYGVKRGRLKKYYGVTIPNEVKENTQSYIEYALPKLKEFLNVEEPDLISLKGEILADREDSEGTEEDVTKVEYDTYYEVKEDGFIEGISAEEDDNVAKIEFTNAYFSMFFELGYEDCESDDICTYDEIVLQKPNTFVINETVTVNANLEDGTNITAEPIKEDVLSSMKEHLESLGIKNVLSSYELKLNGTVDGKITLTFALGTKYNGQSIYILHQKKDGSYENFVETVVEGRVTISVSELSPFVIALNQKEENDIDDSTGSVEPDVEPDRVLDDQPKTGVVVDSNNQDTIISIATLFIAVMGLLKLRR